MAGKKEVSRRAFMRDAAKTAAGITAGAAVVKTARADVYKSILPSSVLGANEMIRTGHIGLGVMGSGNLKYNMQRPDVMPIAVCDLHPRNRGKGHAMAQAKNPQATVHENYKEIIDNPDVDAVICSTTDHWHAMVSIAACDAGKAVYCEKPLGTTVKEGQAMVAAAKRNNTVFQCGTIQRSGDHFKEAIEIVKSGALGQIGHVHTFSIDMLAPTGIGNPPDVTDPEKWKSYGPWETYQGWVEHKPFNVNRWLYNFRWFYDYAGGKLTDWGVHLVDIVLSAMGEDKPPKTVSASGGKFIITDNRTTPDTINVSWEFDSYLLTFTNRVWNSYGDQIAPADNHGIIFYGTKGSLKLSRAGYNLIPGANQQSVPEPGEYESAEAKENTSASVLYEPHLENFINCIRSGEKPISHVESCHNSSTVCHIGNAAYLAGAKLTWDAATEQFAGGPADAVKQANEWIARPYLNGYTLG